MNTAVNWSISSEDASYQEWSWFFKARNRFWIWRWQKLVWLCFELRNLGWYKAGRKPKKSHTKSKRVDKRGIWGISETISFTMCLRFQEREVNISEERQHFLKCWGKCLKSKFGNRFNGFAKSGPCKITGEIIIRARTWVTSLENHAVVKRPLNGEIRMRVGQGQTFLYKPACIRCNISFYLHIYIFAAVVNE